MIYIIAWMVSRHNRRGQEIRSGPGAKQGPPGSQDRVWATSMRELEQQFPRQDGWCNHQVTIEELGDELLRQEIRAVLRERRRQA